MEMNTQSMAIEKMQNGVSGLLVLLVVVLVLVIIIS